MSDGLARVTGAPVTVKMPNGKTFFVSALTIKDFGTIEQHLLSMRPTSAEEFRPLFSMTDNIEVHKYIIDKATESIEKNRARYNTVPVSEVQEWGETVSGSIYAGWLSLRKEHPELTLDGAADVIDMIGMDPFKSALLQASGIDQLGNSIGPSSIPSKPLKAEGRTGGPSTETSANTAT